MGSFTASDIQHFISQDGTVSEGNCRVSKRDCTYYAMIRYKKLDISL
jgi:hypothetical protein